MSNKNYCRLAVLFVLLLLCLLIGARSSQVQFMVVQPGVSGSKALFSTTPEEYTIMGNDEAPCEKKDGEDGQLSTLGKFIEGSSWLFPSHTWPNDDHLSTCDAIGNTCGRREGSDPASVVTINSFERNHYGVLSDVCVTTEGGIFTFNADFSALLSAPTPRFKRMNINSGGMEGEQQLFEQIEYIWQDESGQLTNFAINNLRTDRLKNGEDMDQVSNLCFRNTTFVLQLFNPNLDVSCCNLGHILGKSINAVTLRQEYAPIIEQNGGTSVQVFAYVPEQHFRRPTRPAATRLFEFMQRVYAKNWVSITASMSKKPVVGDLSQAVCVPNMVFGLDRRVGHNGVRTTSIYRATKQLRKQIMDEYPNITVRPQPRKSKPWVVTFFSRRDVGRRLIVNEAELLEEVRKHDEIKPFFIINSVEQSKMSMVEQGALAANTDVLVSTHGMALTWSFLMPPRSIMLEISNYYRFGYLEGFNQNCNSVFGAHCGFFHLHHLLMYAPVDKKKGERSGHVNVNIPKFITFLKAAKCLLEAGKDEEKIQECHIAGACGEACRSVAKWLPRANRQNGNLFKGLVGCAIKDSNDTMDEE